MVEADLPGTSSLRPLTGLDEIAVHAGDEVLGRSSAAQWPQRSMTPPSGFAATALTEPVDLNELSMTPLDFDRNAAKGFCPPRDMRDDGCGRRCEFANTRSNGKLGAALAFGNIGPPAWMEFLGYSADDFFRIAEQLGVSTITVIGTFQPGLVSMPETAESFASVGG